MARMAVPILLLVLATVAPGQRQRHPAIARTLAQISAEQIETTVRKLVSFGTRHTLSVDKPDRGVEAAGRWIKSEMEKSAARSNGLMTVEMQAFDPRQFRGASRIIASRTLGGRMVHNIVAKLKGSDDNRVIVVSGHYDSRASRGMDIETNAPGANDDASGTAVIMELARVMATQKPRATVYFVAFTGEEQGLWGSTHFARWCDANGLNIEAMITNDIVGGATDSQGRSDPHTVRVFSEGVPPVTENSNQRLRKAVTRSGESDSPSRQLARYVEECASRYLDDIKVRLVFRQDRFLRGGDHRPFNQLGYPAIRMTEPRENYTRQHQDVRVEGGVHYGDRPDLVDYDYTRRVARVNAGAVLSLALAPAPPTGVAIDISRLMNETRLVWNSSGDKTIASYEVLMRRTHEYTWTKTVDAGSGTSITVPESKDDWLFAVRVVDHDGNRSLPVYPGVVRRSP